MTMRFQEPMVTTSPAATVSPALNGNAAAAASSTSPQDASGIGATTIWPVTGLVVVIGSAE